MSGGGDGGGLLPYALLLALITWGFFFPPSAGGGNNLKKNIYVFKPAGGGVRAVAGGGGDAPVAGPVCVAAASPRVRGQRAARRRQSWEEAARGCVCVGGGVLGCEGVWGEGQSRRVSAGRVLAGRSCPAGWEAARPRCFWSDAETGNESLS